MINYGSVPKKKDQLHLLSSHLISSTSTRREYHKTLCNYRYHSAARTRTANPDNRTLVLNMFGRIIVNLKEKDIPIVIQN